MTQNVDWKKKTQEIFKILNEYRKNPKLLAKHLEGLKKYLDKNKVLSEPNKIPIQMVEGEIVISEAIKFLYGLAPLPPFELDPYLCQSAQQHVEDIGPKGLLSYQSSDGTEPEERINKFGNYVEALGENIDFGPNDALGVIVSLTLDDGEEERPHRDNLFKSDYRKIGIACGPHKSEYQMCVMDFAYDFIPHKPEPKIKVEKDASYNINSSLGKANDISNISKQTNIYNQGLEQQNRNIFNNSSSLKQNNLISNDYPIER